MKLKQKLAFLPPLALCATAVFVWLNQPGEKKDGLQTTSAASGARPKGIVTAGVGALPAEAATVGGRKAPLLDRLKPVDLKDVDTRKLLTVAAATEKISQEREEAMRQFKKDFPNAYVDFDPISHSPRQITVPGRNLTGPLGGGSSKDSVTAFVDKYKDVFGHDASMLSDPQKSRVITESENEGVTHLVWEQLLNGIPVEGRSFSASVTSDGSIVSLGDLFMADDEIAAAPSSQPVVSVEQAISLAANETGMQMSAAGLKEAAGSPVASPEYVKHQGTGISGESQSRLIWFPSGDGSMVLAWDVTFTPANRVEMFRSLVDASKGGILARQSLMHAANYNAQVRIWGNASGGQPADSPMADTPTTRTSTTTTEPGSASTSLVTYDAVTAGTTNVPSPNGWMDLVDLGGGNATLLTAGANVQAGYYNGSGFSMTQISSSFNGSNGNITGVFDYTPNLTVAPSDSITRQASAVSAFALGNWMHDQLWNVGFKTSDGAFEGASRRFVILTQHPSYTNHPTDVVSVPLSGSPTMSLGLFNGTSPNRDAAFDAQIALHEYTHGMTNRLVGDGTALISASDRQTMAMNEGWADFFSLAVLSQAGDSADGVYPFGSYSRRGVPSSLQNNYYFGARLYPYSTSPTVNPLTYKDIDPTAADVHAGTPHSPTWNQVTGGWVSLGLGNHFVDINPFGIASISVNGNQVIVTGNGNFSFTATATVTNGGTDNTQSITSSTVPATGSTPQVTTFTLSGTFEDADTVYAELIAGIGISNTYAVSQYRRLMAYEKHSAGTVWASTLWEARANVVQNKGFSTGNDRIMKLVTAAMKLVPHPSPTWIEERNNILASDNASYGREDEPEIWAGFAKRGMGIGASAPAATTTTGVVESFDLAIPLGSTTVAVGGSFDVYGWGLGAVPAAGSIPAQSKVSVTVGGVAATVQNNGVAPSVVPTQASEATVANAGKISITVPALASGTHPVVLSHYGWSQNVGSITVQSPEIAVEQPAGTNIADGGSKSFGSVAVGSSTSLTFTVNNTGAASLTGLTYSINGTNASDFVLTTAPTAPVAASGTTTFVVTFTPGGAGSRTAAIHFASNDADENPFDITLTGTGLVPEIAVEQPAGTNIVDNGGKDFGVVLPGSSTSLTFTMNNTGGAPLTGLTPTINGTHASDFVLTTAPTAPVAAGGSTTFTITFTPGAAGARSAAIHLTNNDSDENPFDINLTGTGAAPEIAVEQPAGTNLVDGSATANLGSILTGSSNSLTFTLKNIGTTDLTGISTSISGTNAGDFVITAAPASSVAAAGSTTLTVTFTAGALGARTASLQIASNDSDENPFDIALTGTGTLPEITVSVQGGFPSLADGDTTPTAGEGTVLGTTFAPAQAIVKNVVIKNDGTAPLNLGAITVTGANYTTNLTGVSTSLAPGASTNLPITFQAAAGGVYQATVQIPSDDADESTFDFVVSATYGAVTSVNNNELVRLSPLPSSWAIGATGLELAGVTTAAILDGTGASVLSLSINPGTRTNTFLDLSTTTLPTTLTGEYFLGLDGNSTGISIYIRNTGPRLKVDGADKPALVTANFIGEVRVAPAVINGVAAEPATATTTVTLTNTGETTLSVTAMPKTGTGNADFTLSPTATSYTILAGASRTITVTFNPSALGARNADYGITSNSTLYPSGAGGYFAKFEGTGVDPDIELAPFGDDMPVIVDDDVTPSTAEGTEYGTVAVNDYSNNWGFFTIWNKGTSPLTIVSVTMLAGSTNSLVEFPLQTFTTYPLEIGPGGQDTFYVGFQPLAAATTVKYATLRILCNDNNAGASTAESDYRFRVQGKCLRPVLEVRGKGNVITSNAAPTGANGTALGSAVVNSGYVERAFKLSNLTNMTGYNGNDGMAITFDNIEILPSAAGNTSYLDFYTSWPFSIWGAGLGFPNYDSLYVSCSPTATGARTALIKLTSNASLSATVTTPQVFSLRVSATGTTAPVLGTGPDTTDFTSHATVSSGTALVSAMVVDGEGRTLVAGNFTSINGTARTRLARFDADGVLDTTFNPTINNTVNCITVQPNGDILIGGIFTQVNGVNRGRLARLHSDGTLDADFRAGANTTSSAVNSITWMPSVQKWLIGGNFVQFGTFPTTGTTAATSLVARYRLALVDDTGALDTTFNLAANPGSATFAAATTVNSIVVDTAGRVWIGGGFTQVGNIGGTPQSRGNLAVILPGAGGGAGGLDPDCATPSYTGGAVNCIVPEPQGTIMVGGDFTGGTSAYGTLLTSTTDYLQRLDLIAGGSGQPANLFVFNTSFTPVLAAGGVNTVASQAGGGLLVGGLFTSVTAKTVSFATGSEVISTSPATLTRIRLARLDVNGNVDADFNPNYGLPGTPTSSCAEMNGITIDETGDVYLGGRFTYIGATLRTNAARLSNPIATYGFSRTPTQLTITSSEASPTPLAVTFEVWDAGLEQWTTLDDAIWNGAQWVLPLGNPVSGSTRAKCVIPGGLGNASTGLVYYY